jgi:hypothetical protein
MKQPKLEKLIKYKNKIVIDSFLKSFDVSRSEAEQIFIEMLKFLWISISNYPKSKKDQAIGIDHPLTIIDEMWHIFLLNTRDYLQFSHDYFGSYVHHKPSTNEDQIAFD